MYIRSTNFKNNLPDQCNQCIRLQVLAIHSNGGRHYWCPVISKKDYHEPCQKFIEKLKRPLQKVEKEYSIEEIIEDLRNWESMFFSESETKWLMNKAADYLEELKEEKND